MHTAKLSVALGLCGAILSMTGGSAQSEEFHVNERVALPFPAGITVSSQCGAVDDLQHVEFYQGDLGVTRAYVDTNEKSTAQLQWLSDADMKVAAPDLSPGNVAGQRWCTATLISKNQLLTAGHCFDVAKGEEGWVTPFSLGADGQPVYAESKAIAKLQFANFEYQLNGTTGVIRTPIVFPVTALVEYREGQLDYAVVELGPNKDGKLAGDLYTPAKFLTTASDKDALLAIIQHPQGDPKKIEAGVVLGKSGSDLFYSDIDTFGGSSGSGVRNADGSVVAVHTNGGCEIEPDPDSANRGVLLEAIAKVSNVF